MKQIWRNVFIWNVVPIFTEMVLFETLQSVSGLETLDIENKLDP